MSLRFTWLLLLSLAFQLPQAHAQLDEAQRKALARSLFEEGLELARDDQWTEAADRFRRALELKDSAVLSYNLAVALGKLGQVVEASELLLQIVRDPEARADTKRDAQRELELVQPRIGTLEIVLRGQLDSHEVALDDHVVDAAALGVPMPVDPGEHVVVLRGAGRVLQRVEAVVPEAGERRVELTVPQNVGIAAAPTPADAARSLASRQPLRREVAAAADDAGEAGVWESPWLWAGVGGAAVTAAVVVLLASGQSGGDAAESPVRGNLGSGTIVVGGSP